MKISKELDQIFSKIINRFIKYPLGVFEIWRVIKSKISSLNLNKKSDKIGLTFRKIHNEE